MSTPVLELRDVRGAYGRIEVLHGVDFVVPERSVVALLGPNGAGKTTTLKIASGQMRPTAGCVHITGKHVNGASADELARAGVCAIPEGRGIFPNLTVEENLRMVTFGGASLRDVEQRSYTQFPKLKQRRRQVAGTMSGGEQQMLAMSRALTAQPKLLLLDELSMGLAPVIVEGLFEAVAHLAREGITIVLVEQFARIALPVADYAAIMVNGRVALVGEPADIADDVDAAYLGTTAA